jgi:O-antigen/teichoic acid export membrane protein
LKYVLTNEKLLFYVFISLSVVYLIATMFLGNVTIKKSEFLKKEKPKKTKQTSPTNLTKNEKKGANKFLIAMAALALSGIFFANIDKVMLGYFVQAEFIGYYTVALSLIGGISLFLSFAALVLLPIFSRMKGKKLEIALKKSRNLIFMLSIVAFIFTLLFAPIIISIIYGSEYALAINILRLFSLLLVFLALTALYQTYYISQGKPKKIAKLLIISTILNIVLNYILITSLLPYGHLAAVYGASIATIISKGFYLGGLILRRKKR